MMLLTFMDYVVLFSYICGAGFCSYLTHEIAGAIHSMLHDD